MTPMGFSAEDLAGSQDSRVRDRNPQPCTGRYSLDHFSTTLNEMLIRGSSLRFGCT